MQQRDGLRRGLRRRLGLIVTVPAAAVTEWWCGRTDIRERILRGLRVEPVDLALSQLAGEAVAAVRGATAVDAIVMASAPRRGDIVYRSAGRAP